jgi:hypothetical protein
MDGRAEMIDVPTAHKCEDPMNQAKALLGLLIALIATATLLGCDNRLPRPWEPTTPHKTLAGA